MGAPISAVVANLYMEFFEKVSLEVSTNKNCPMEEICILNRSKYSLAIWTTSRPQSSSPWSWREMINWLSLVAYYIGERRLHARLHSIEKNDTHGKIPSLWFTPPSQKGIFKSLYDIATIVQGELDKESDHLCRPHLPAFFFFFNNGNPSRSLHLLGFKGAT